MSDHLSNLIAIVAAIIGGAATIVGSAYGLRRIFSVHLENSAVDLRFLGLSCRRFRVSDIEGAEVLPFAALIPFRRRFRADLLLAEKWNGYRKSLVPIKR